MGEAGGVEVEFCVILFTPVNPALEVGDIYLIAVDYLSLEIAVDLVEVQSVVARNETFCLQDVGSQLIDVTCLTWIVACTLDAAR